MMRYTKALSMQNTSKPKIMNPTIQIKMQQIRMTKHIIGQEMWAAYKLGKAKEITAAAPNVNQIP
jgi:hypothetical protein